MSSERQACVRSSLLISGVLSITFTQNSRKTCAARLGRRAWVKTPFMLVQDLHAGDEFLARRRCSPGFGSATIHLRDPFRAGTPVLRPWSMMRKRLPWSLGPSGDARECLRCCVTHAQLGEVWPNGKVRPNEYGCDGGASRCRAPRGDGDRPLRGGVAERLGPAPGALHVLLHGSPGRRRAPCRGPPPRSRGKPSRGTVSGCVPTPGWTAALRFFGPSTGLPHYR